MSGPWQTLTGIAAGRAVTPLVLGFFLLFYVGVAFFSDEALITLMGVMQKSGGLQLLLALVPLNLALRLASEIRRSRRRRSLLAGDGEPAADGLFDDAVSLEGSAAGGKIERHLLTAGYRVRASSGNVVAHRGVSLLPARLFIRLGFLALALGGLVSIATRQVSREMLVEGEQLTGRPGLNAVLERISVHDDPRALFFSRRISMVVNTAEGRGRLREFGLYPPGVLDGAFLYPRYLGLAPQLVFAAPGMGQPLSQLVTPMIYPPGKEDTLAIEGTPYALVLALVPNPQTGDPFVTGQGAVLVKIVRDKQLLASGTIPFGGEFRKDGFMVAIPVMKRLVSTDFVSDYGVPLIWGATLCFLAGGLLYLPIRVFFPRREMVFLATESGILALSRAEGGGRRHGEMFHAALDLLSSAKVSASA